MNVLDFLKGNFQYHAGSIGASWTPVRPSANYLGQIGAQTAAGIQVNSDSGMNSGAAFACTRARAETLATLPAVVYENMDGDQRAKARQNPMWSLLHDQPNPEMDSVTWYSMSAKRLVNRGNALSLIEFNGRGLPIALWPVHNSRWEAHRGPSVLLPNGRFRPGELFYRIWPDDSQRFVDVGPDEVLNIVGFDTENGIVARGVISRARQEIALDIAEQEYAASMFKNGAVPLGLIKHPWIDDKEQRDNFRSDINAMHAGRENWNKVGILWDKDAEWMKLNFTPEDVQAIESRVFSAKAICRYYNVPPAIIQIFDDYKFSTVEAMLKQFVMMSVRPDAVCFERAIKTQLLDGIPGEDVFLEFALEGLLRGDPKTQAEANAILRQWGVINADEWRQRDLNLNPLPNGVGQAYLAPINYATLESVVSGASRTEDEPQISQPKWNKAFVAALGQLTSGGRPVGQITTDELAWRVIRTEARRLIANEVNAIERRIKGGPNGFAQWVEEYYAKFQPTLAGVFAVPCEGLSDDPQGYAAQLACEYCDDSKSRLLDAITAEGEFSNNVQACIADWPQRAESLGGSYERAAA